MRSKSRRYGEYRLIMLLYNVLYHIRTQFGEMKFDRKVEIIEGRKENIGLGVSV